ncbi:MAG: class I SAM-dependent rRNA methyltransferase [bacterium]
MLSVHSTVILENAAAKRLADGVLWFSEREVVGRLPRLPGIARVLDKRKRFLGLAFLSPKERYFLRMITRDDATIDRAFWRELIVRANERRTRLSDITDAYRVVYSESDGMPSVVVDRYNDIFSFQITSAGAEQIKADLVEIITEIFHPESIVEKDDIAIRGTEGLPRIEKVVYGQKRGTIVREGDQLFDVDVLGGQKTGAYLDYRGIRLKARDLARGDCLDAFCYNGWFSCQIARAARHVTAVDSSQSALDAAIVNARLNKHQNVEFVKADAFDYLAECDRSFDFIHIDPPAMAKEHAKLSQAVHGYGKLISNALRILSHDGILMISSCSHKISERILETAVLDCIRKSDLSGEVIWRGIQDADHPVMRHLPESLYLKALAVQIR